MKFDFLKEFRYISRLKNLGICESEFTYPFILGLVRASLPKIYAYFCRIVIKYFPETKICQ